MTTQSLAYQVGSALGLIAGTLLHARKPSVRWIKRALVLGVFLWVVLANFSWIVSSLLTIGCVGLMILALVKGDVALLENASESGESSDDEGYRHGYQGYGYYYSNGFKRNL